MRRVLRVVHNEAVFLHEPLPGLPHGHLGQHVYEERGAREREHRSHANSQAYTDTRVRDQIRGLAELGGEQCNCEIMAAVLQIHGLVEGEAAKHEYDDGAPKFGSVEEYRAHAIREGFFEKQFAEDDGFSDDDYTGLAEDA